MKRIKYLPAIISCLLLVGSAQLSSAQRTGTGSKTRRQRTTGKPTSGKSKSRTRSNRLGGTNFKPAKGKSIRTIYLKNVKAEVFSAAVSKLFHDSRIAVAQPRTNSVVIYATKDQHKQLEELVGQIDRAPLPVHQLKIFSLQYVKPNNQLLDILQVTLRDRESVRIAVDEKGNRVIARGTAADLSMIEAVIARLDTPSGRREIPRAITYTVKILWLTTDDTMRTKKLPNELAPVALALMKVGVKRPKLVQELVIASSSDSEFKLSGRARKKNKDWKLAVDGKILTTPQKKAGRPFRLPRLEISLTTSPAGEKASSDVDLKTTIPAPIGNYTVLGVSPNQDGSSNLFVIRVDAKRSDSR